MRTAAFAVLATYVGLAILAQVSVLRDGDLGLTLARRDGAVRVAWVMPAGHAWYDGVRPGMEVVSLDDRPAASIGDPLPPRVARAEVRDAGGRILLARVVLGGMVHAPLKWSLWTVGLAFALCGSTIASRRPDLAAARAFVAFCACAAFALAVSPSAGGPHPPWALVVNFTSLIGIAAAILSFVRALDGRNAFRLHLAAAVVLLVGYAAAVIVRPELYSGLRIAGLLYVVLSIAAAIAILARRALRHRLTARGRQAGIVLFGIVVGALPFAALSVAPLALGLEQVAPAYLTVLATAFIPASAAIAVVQSQFLGIRRLVHRGMVYALTTSVLIVATVLAAAFVAPVLQSRSTPQGANLLIGALVAAGVALFYPLRLGASRLVDRFLYDDVGDPQRLIAALHDDVADAAHATGFEVWIERLAGSLHVESVLLFAAVTSERPRLVASAGSRKLEVLDSVAPELGALARQARGRDAIELRWGGDRLLVAPLRVDEHGGGLLILGPKEGGEVFVAAEKQLIGAVAPVLALALHKGALSDELQLVNQRLIDAEEAERARLASDVHDGPLQKAILLSGAAQPLGDREALGRELVRELREVCSRLRPAILDDLGLVPSLEWLLEDAGKRFDIVPRLELRGVDESGRFPPAVELALFRITQEAISNATKHGKPKTIAVTLAGGDHALTLQVDDDGNGFAAADPRATSGFGLPGIRGRVGRLGGSFDIRSAPGAGTSVVVRVPLDGPIAEQR